MDTHSVSLTAAEWNVMECLWEHSPCTGREISLQMQERCGWSRSTTLTLLSRLEAKGAVDVDVETGKKTFSPLVGREDAALQEAESFLERAYKGSVSRMVSALTRKQPLAQEEIDELYAILKKMEADGDD